MEYCNLTYEEIKIIVMKKFKIQENSERQYSDPRNKINEKENALSKRLKI